jgi:hypothetical protein
VHEGALAVVTNFVIDFDALLKHLIENGTEGRGKLNIK